MAIKTLHDQMKELAIELSLPKLHAEDLDVDLCILQKYKDHEYVWLLREAGTILLPLKIGVDYHLFEHYTPRSSELFHIDASGETITSITVDRVLELGKLKPLCDTLWSTDVDQFDTQVETLLGYRHWNGPFTTPEIPTNQWGDWLKYFRDIDQTVMIEFMENAIDYRKSLEYSVKVA